MTASPVWNMACHLGLRDDPDICIECDVVPSDPAHMASRRNRPINLPAPYLKRIWLEPSRITDRAAYPFCLPLLRDDFELSFDRAITIIVGENGTGKSTLLEGIAVLASARASTSSTSRNRRCRPRARSNS